MELPQPGAVFAAKYRLESVLGRGGFATVYKALDMGANRAVAVKVLDPQGDAYRPDIESRFHREVRIVANLRDPHTVTMFDFGRSPEGLLFMVFEYLPGADLRQLIEARGALDEASAVHVLLQVLSSLREAHQAGLLHRDLKPENVRIYEYMGDPLRAAVLDFGIAKPTQANAGAGITSAGALVGTPQYMSPEQLLSQQLTPASDLYSLGLVAYEMLTGQSAIEGNAIASQLQVISGAVDVRLPAHVAVSPTLRAVVDRMVEREPSHRPQSAEEVLAALAPMQAAASLRPPDAGASRTWSGPVPPPGAAAPPPTQSGPMSTPWGARPGQTGPFASTGSAPHGAPPTAVATRDTSTPTLILVVLACLIGLAGLLVWNMLGTTEQADGPRALPDGLTRVTDAPRPTPAVKEPPKPAVVAREEIFAVPDAGAPDVPSGCGHAAPFEGFDTLLDLQGLAGSAHKLYIPAGYDPDRRHPLLVMFHDVGDDGRNILLNTQMNRIADERGVVLLLPEDPVKAMRLVGPWMEQTDLDSAVSGIDVVKARLCIDESRVFAFGHGAGGRAADRLPCATTAVTATATTAYRLGPGEEPCRSSPPVPRLDIVPLRDGHSPPKGGVGCEGKLYDDNIPITQHERVRREANGCSTRKTPWRKHALGTCVAWDGECENPYVICRVDGGRNWPGTPPREFDVSGCDGPSVHYPYAQTIWDFFDTYAPGDATPEEDK